MVNPPLPGGHSGEAILIINSQSRPSETQKQGNESCLLPPLNSTRPSVITEEQLRIPARARREYHRACSALGKKKSSPAERHLRQAVQEYPKYATAWVTLGQVPADENRFRGCQERMRAGCSGRPDLSTRTIVSSRACLPNPAMERGTATRQSRA